jgi:O-phosphoseryl-tRNA(Cys) synthetase
MAARINPKWAANIESMILQSKTIDETLTFRAAAQWLIATLSRYGLPYKVYQLGCGVVRVTMTTDTCPCCKRKLE